MDGDSEGTWAVVGEAGLDALVLDHILFFCRLDKDEL